MVYALASRAKKNQAFNQAEKLDSESIETNIKLYGGNVNHLAVAATMCGLAETTVNIRIF